MSRDQFGPTTEGVRVVESTASENGEQLSTDRAGFAHLHSPITIEADVQDMEASIADQSTCLGPCSHFRMGLWWLVFVCQS